QLLAEEYELDFCDRFPASALTSFDDDAVGRVGDVPGRPAVDSPTDVGERDRGGPDLLDAVDASFEAGFEGLRMSRTGEPLRTARVDDPRGLEVPGGRGHGLARRQTPHMGRLPDLATGLEQCGTGRAVDGSVDPAASEQRRIRGIDDGVDGNLGDIAFENRDLHVSSLDRLRGVAHRA